MLKNKIKLIATFSLIALVAAVIGFASNIAVNADGDEFVKEISEYKTWTKINNEPIKVFKPAIDNFGGG